MMSPSQEWLIRTEPSGVAFFPAITVVQGRACQVRSNAVAPRAVIRMMKAPGRSAQPGEPQL